MRYVALAAAVFCAAVFAFYFQDSLKFHDSPAGKGRGVVLYDRLRTQNGFVLIESFARQGAPACTVMNRKGEFVLSLPGTYCLVLADGGLILGDETNGLSKMDRDLASVWKFTGTFHHDAAVDEETGEIFGWFWNEKLKFNGITPVIADVLFGFDQNGRVNFTWDSLKNLPQTKEITGKTRFEFNESRKQWHISHFNGVQILPSRPVEINEPAFAKGGLLVSTALGPAIAVLSRQSGSVLWSYRDPDKSANCIHTARLTPEGNILYFQNRNSREANMSDDYFSRIIELNPQTKEKVWSFQAAKNHTFFAEKFGSAERLSNGNTLVSHLANGGGVFEVTKSGRVVWDWQNSEAQPILNAGIYRARFLTEHQVKALIEKAKALPEIQRRDYFQF